jgi:hypothetical protein
VRLSRWWTQSLKEPRTDIFWRTAGSGARAKTRGRKGLTTANSDGDIIAIDPVGEPFVDLITCELKRGYSRDTVADLLDKPPKAALQTYEKWILQAEESHRQAGSYSWMIVHQRDRRLPLVILPDRVLYDLSKNTYPDSQVPNAIVSVLVPGCKYPHKVSVLTLDSFLAQVSPERVKELSRET